MRFSRIFPLLFPFIWAGLLFGADNFTKKHHINFFRDVSSRDLEGFSTRSDGRLLAGPTLRSLPLELGVDLVWDIEPQGDGRWLIATGPDGKILELSFDRSSGEMTTRVWADLDGGQVFKLLALSDGRVVALSLIHI